MYTIGRVKVWAGPSNEYSDIMRTEENFEVHVTGRASTGWYRVDLGGQEGYISDKNLTSEKSTVKEETKPSYVVHEMNERMIVVGDTELISGPGPEYEGYGAYLFDEMEVSVIGRVDNGWYKVRDDITLKEGFVNEKSLK